MINTKSPSWFEEKLPEWYLVEQNFKEIIKKNYSLSGFTPIDTPNVERSEVLLAKWVEDNEIYGIKRLKAEDKNDFEICLRFDLTVPLARYISKYEWEITFPFKRQHIARVYRWERPQKWRYREFYQADIDIIWNEKLALFADVEIISTIFNSLKSLDFWEFVININNKKLLSGFLSNLNIKKIPETISIIDKKDKVNRKELEVMFRENDLNSEQIKSILELIELSEDKNKTNLEIISFFENIIINNKTPLPWFKEWLDELKYIYKNLINIWVDEKYLKINPSISRGLNYYTGLVFETFIKWAENMWSIASGGRYDDLCSNFSKNNFPWVGGSIWLSRLIAVLDELKKLEYNKKTITDILVINMWEDVLEANLKLVKDLRDIWLNTEIYLDSNTKFSKQIKYADNKKIKYVIIMGKDEIEAGILQIKNLTNWNQEEVDLNKIKNYFK